MLTRHCSRLQEARSIFVTTLLLHNSKRQLHHFPGGDLISYTRFFALRKQLFRLLHPDGGIFAIPVVTCGGETEYDYLKESIEDIP